MTAQNSEKLNKLLAILQEMDVIAAAHAEIEQWKRDYAIADVEKVK